MSLLSNLRGFSPPECLSDTPNSAAQGAPPVAKAILASPVAGAGSMLIQQAAPPSFAFAGAQLTGPDQFNDVIGVLALSDGTVTFTFPQDLLINPPQIPICVSNGLVLINDNSPNGYTLYDSLGNFIAINQSFEADGMSYGIVDNNDGINFLQNDSGNFWEPSKVLLRGQPIGGIIVPLAPFILSTLPDLTLEAIGVPAVRINNHIYICARFNLSGPPFTITVGLIIIELTGSDATTISQHDPNIIGNPGIIICGNASNVYTISHPNSGIDNHAIINEWDLLGNLTGRSITLDSGAGTVISFGPTFPGSVQTGLTGFVCVGTTIYCAFAVDNSAAPAFPNFRVLNIDTVTLAITDLTNNFTRATFVAYAAGASAFIKP